MKRQNWRVAAASVQGVSHLRADIPCQDAHHFALHGEGALVAAVADGAGSALRGEVGAEVAARAAIEFLAEAALPGAETCAWETFLHETLKVARIAVEAQAGLREMPVRELATTLIVAVATADCVAVAQVGDGAAVIESEEGVLALTRPHLGEHANETTFLIAPEALDVAEIRVWQGRARHLALFSDGLQRLALKLPEGTAHAPFFGPLFRFVEQAEDLNAAHSRLEAFLRSPRITDRADDDLTLLLAYQATMGSP